MSTVRRLAKNAVILLVAQCFGYVVSFLYMIALARYLGPSDYGVIIYAVVFTSIFSILTDFGLQQLSVIKISRDQEIPGKYLINVSALKLLLAVISYAIIVLFTIIMNNSPETGQVVYLIGASVIIGSFNLIFYSIFQAYEKMEYQGLSQILSSVIMGCGVLFIVFNHMSVVFIGYLYVVASIITLLFTMIILKIKILDKKHIHFSGIFKLDFRLCKEIFRDTLPFGITAVMGTIYFAADSVILFYTQGDASVGYYGAATRITQVLLFIPTIWSMAIFPVMVKLFEGSLEWSVAVTGRTFKYLAVLAIPMAIGLTLLSPQIIPLIYGPEYSSTVPALQIIAWSTAFMFMGIAFVILLQSTNKQGLVTITNVVCATLNVLLNVIFIPAYGVIAASIILAITSMIHLLMLYIFSFTTNKHLINRQYLSIIGRALLSGVCMGIFVYLFRNLSMLIVIPGAVCLYFLVAFALKIFDKTDLQLMKNVFSISPE